MKKIALFSVLSFGLAACLWHTSTEQKTVLLNVSYDVISIRNITSRFNVNFPQM